MAGYVLDRKVYVNAAKDKVVDEGDPEAAFLLGVPGTTIDEMEARRIGLHEVLYPVGPPKNPELLRRQRVAAGDAAVLGIQEKQAAVDAAMLVEDYEEAHRLISEMEAEKSMNKGDVEDKEVTPESTGAENKSHSAAGTRRVVRQSSTASTSTEESGQGESGEKQD